MILKRPPVLVIIVGLLLIATGIGGSIQHQVWAHLSDLDGITMAVVELAAIVAGVFMLLGHNWARWLAMAWIAFHVAISIQHLWPELTVHLVMFAAFAFALFRRSSREFFHASVDDGEARDAA